MPIPSVEPIPLPPTEFRFAVPDDEQEASYFAASARTESFRRRSRRAMVHDMFSSEIKSSFTVLLYFQGLQRSRLSSEVFFSELMICAEASIATCAC